MSEYISDYDLVERWDRKTKQDFVLQAADKTKAKKQQEVKQVQMEKRGEIKKQKEEKWVQKAAFVDKFQYLAKKLPYLECKYEGRCSQTSETQKSICSACWWNNITIPFSEIQTCSKCAQDAEKYKQLLEGEYEDVNFEYRKHETCSRWCLWHDYFFAQIIEMNTAIDLL